MSEIKQVRMKKGTFYLSSETDGGEGWTKQEFKSPSDGTDMVRYHKEISIEGNLMYLAMKKDKFKGNCLSMLIRETPELTYGLEIPIMSTGKIPKTNEYFNSVIGSLENVEKGDVITMFVNNKNKDKSGNLYRNIVTLNYDKKLIKSNFQFSEVPRWNKIETVDDFGENIVTYDPSPTNKFYIDLAKEVVEKFGAEPSVELATASTVADEMPSLDPSELDAPF